MGYFVGRTSVRRIVYRHSGLKSILRELIMLIQQSIEKKLTETFNPTFLQIENESHMHSSGRGSESHFKVTLVTEAFNGKRGVARHQAIYQCLNAELEGGVHALALHTYTPEEWQAIGEQRPDSPRCAGVGL